MNKSLMLIQILLSILILPQINASTPLQEITSFDETSIENFQETGEINVGWIKYSCNEPLEKLLKISKYAITAKFVPSSKSVIDDYKVTANVCSNPIYALNNGYELSYTLNKRSSPLSSTASNNDIIDFVNPDDWIGTYHAKQQLLNNKCSKKPALKRLSDGYIFRACDENPNGIHIISPNECNVDIWLGFDANKSKWCQLTDDGSYLLSTSLS